MLSVAALRLPSAVRRIVLWSLIGCTLVREGGRWRLRRPDWMTGTRGPAPKLITDATARAAIEAGARVEAPDDDLFGRAA